MRRSLVTGGAGGLGEAICIHLAEQDHHVIVHANRNPEKAETLVAAIRDKGGSAETVCFDVRNHDLCQSKLTALTESSPIQVLVNNAGIHDDAPLAGMSREQWDRVLDVSLNGYFNVTRPLLMSMIRSRWGRIVNISSVSGRLGNRGQSNYAAAKAGLHGATKALALELATRKITVNTVAPGMIGAGMAASIPQSIVDNVVPMKRMGTAHEVAAAVGFLVSDQAAYITGQIIGIDGGMT